MATWRVCTLVALAVQLVPAASTDNGALVQSRVDLHRQEPQSTATEELVASCVNMLPLQTLPAEVCKVNTKKLAESVVAAFRDPHFALTAYDALTNQTRLWKLFQQVTAKRVERLDHLKVNKNKTQEQVFRRLHRFWSRHGEDFSRALAAEAGVKELVSEALPQGYLRELHPAYGAGPVAVYNMSFQYISPKVGDIVDGTFVSNDSTLLCDHVGGMIANLSFAYSTYPTAVRAKKTPELESAVMSFAPHEDGSLLVGFLNEASKVSLDMSILFDDIIHSLKESNSKLLEERFKCQPI